MCLTQVRKNDSAAIPDHARNQPGNGLGFSSLFHILEFRIDNITIIAAL